MWIKLQLDGEVSNRENTCMAGDFSVKILHQRKIKSLLIKLGAKTYMKLATADKGQHQQAHLEQDKLDFNPVKYIPFVTRQK